MIDFEKVKMMYNFGKNLKLSDSHTLIKASKMKSFHAGEYLIQEGSIKRELFFIRKGLVRQFAINTRGDEITTSVKSENQIVASEDIIFFDQASRHYFQAIEPTDIYKIDYDLLQTIIAKKPALEENRKFVLQNLLKDLLVRVDNFVLLTPEERYLDFIQSYPNLDNRVPNKYIANILGITPVSLSRIRKRIASKKK